MDLKQLNYFIAVVENEFNLSKTSKKLQITQPTLSQMIIDLEKEYKIKLFEKEFGRFKRLTSIGDKFYRDAKKIINKVEQLNYELKQENDLFRGRVRIGIPPLIISFLCAKSIPAFFAQHPDIKLEIVEKDAYELYDMLAKNELDLVITTEPVSNKDIIATPIYSDRIVAHVNEDHSFAHERGINLQNISQEKIMCLNDNFIIHDQLVKIFKANDIDPEFYFTSGQWDLLLHMANFMNGIALLPRPFDDLNYLKMTVPVEIEPMIPWEIVIAYNQHIVKNSDTRKVENFFIDFYHK